MNFDTKAIINLAIGAVGIAGLGFMAYKVYNKKEEQIPEVDITVDKEAMVNRFADAVATNVVPELFEDHIREVWANVNFELEEKFKDHPIAKEALLQYSDALCLNTIEGFKKCA